MYMLDKFYAPTPVTSFYFPAYILGGKSEGGKSRKDPAREWDDHISKKYHSTNPEHKEANCGSTNI